MSDYTWGVDGYGRAHISKKDSNVILFCMIKGNGIGGVWILEAQDNEINIVDAEKFADDMCEFLSGYR